MVLLAVEVWLLGLSTIVLLALGASATLTGLLSMAGVIPETMTALVASSGVGAGLLTLFLWGPMKRAQNVKREPVNTSSDFIGLEFTLSSPLEKGVPSAVSYSGIQWQLELAPHCQDLSLHIGDKVKVVGVEVGKFIVEEV